MVTIYFSIKLLKKFNIIITAIYIIAAGKQLAK